MEQSSVSLNRQGQTLPPLQHLYPCRAGWRLCLAMPGRITPTDLSVIVPLFDKLLHHFLHLLIALSLQVLDEGVQPPRPIVGFHDGLVGLHNTSNPCRQRGSNKMDFVLSGAREPQGALIQPRPKAELFRSSDRGSLTLQINRPDRSAAL